MLEGITLGSIVIDCGNEQETSLFYQKLTGWELRTLYGHPALFTPEGIVCYFAQEDDYVPPVWPEAEGRPQKQIHLDFLVPDVAVAVEYALSIGAHKAETQFGGDLFVTMLDPAGHPFCLCRQG